MNDALNDKNVRFPNLASGIEPMQAEGSDSSVVASLSPKPQRQRGLRERTEHCNMRSQSLVSRPSERFPEVAFCKKVGPRLSVRCSGTSMQSDHCSLSYISSDVACRITQCACLSQQLGESQWTSDRLCTLRCQGFASALPIMCHKFAPCKCLYTQSIM